LQSKSEGAFSNSAQLQAEVARALKLFKGLKLKIKNKELTLPCHNYFLRQEAQVISVSHSDRILIIFSLDESLYGINAPFPLGNGKESKGKWGA